MANTGATSGSASLNSLNLTKDEEEHIGTLYVSDTSVETKEERVKPKKPKQKNTAEKAAHGSVPEVGAAMGTPVGS